MMARTMKKRLNRKMRPSPVSQNSTNELSGLVEGVVFTANNKSQKNVNIFGLGLVLVSFNSDYA